MNAVGMGPSPTWQSNNVIKDIREIYSYTHSSMLKSVHIHDVLTIRM